MFALHETGDCSRWQLVGDATHDATNVSKIFEQEGGLTGTGSFGFFMITALVRI